MCTKPLPTRPPLAAHLRPDFLIFDIDGVLVDATQSYPGAIAEAVARYRQLANLPGDPDVPVTAEQTAWFKQAGGFNDEWVLTYTAALWSTWRAFDPAAPTLQEYVEQIGQAGGGVFAAEDLIRRQASPVAKDAIKQRCTRELLTRLGKECYGGDEACATLFGFNPQFRTGPGWQRVERGLLEPSRLQPWQGRLGIYTGRNRPETDWALARHGFAERFLPHFRMTASDHLVKPDPDGLGRILTRVKWQHVWYIGDTVDDCRTVLAFRRQCPSTKTVTFVGVLDGAMGPAAAVYFTRCGADYTVRTAAEVLDALPAPGRSARR